MDAIKALKQAGYTRAEAERILTIINTHGSNPQNERLYERLISICDDATGGNAAFSTEYGLHVLNEIRGLLGLKPLTE